MGTRAREIIGMDVDKLLKLLRAAFSDEWLAYFQYWVGAKVVKGPMKDAVITELMQHAADELRHADMVALRIVELGGVPVTKPEDWYKETNCGYEAPDDPYVEAILKQNIKGEQCAISTYSNLLKTTRDADPVTYNMVVQILQDEVSHEEDLQNLEEDIQLMINQRR
ncbi:MAG: ferritin-like domain-containing protein [Kiritimatiellae bacterium]|nr:ferritin-like domain-containing protein [Kiritimatiellia bacterium]MDD5522522.1 ferritin-like domain-containing protein [Kiritimatiellia bacterium]